jgi:sRNA-binding protein
VTHDGKNETRPADFDIGARTEPNAANIVECDGEPTPRRHLSPIQIIQLFEERWPCCFSVYEKNRRPLKLNIHEEIIAALVGKIDEKDVRNALRVYVINRAYLKTIKAGRHRFGLDGLPAGTVTKEEHEHNKRRISADAQRRSTKPVDHDDPDGKWARKLHPANADKPRLSLKGWGRS